MPAPLSAMNLLMTAARMARAEMVWGRRYAPVARLIHRLGPCVRGIATIEFAVIAPALIAVSLGSVEVINLLQQDRKLETVATTMAQMISRQTEPFTPSDNQFVFDSALLLFPQVVTEARVRNQSWSSTLQASFASVEFRPKDPACAKNCAYDAYVLWSSGGAVRRPCGRLRQLSDGAEPAYDGLPSALYGPGTVIVVDVAMTYRPLIGFVDLGARRFHKVAYYAPRYRDQIEAVRGTDDEGNALVICA